MIDEKLAKSYLKRSEKQLDCTMTCLATIVALRERGQADVETIWNVSTHINLLSHDLMAYLLLFGLIDDKWTRRTAVRAIATLLYEGCDDLQSMFGKHFRNACAQAGILDEFKEACRMPGKAISQFQRKYERVMKPIRMTSGAHREHDVVSFLTDFMNVDYDEIIAASKEFEEILKKVAALTSQITMRMNEVYKLKR